LGSTRIETEYVHQPAGKRVAAMRTIYENQLIKDLKTHEVGLFGVFQFIFDVSPEIFYRPFTLKN
jgi:hypothetical protein